MIACTVPEPLRAAGRGRRRGGFTLVELLVVMAIMAMLAAMVLGALNAARHATNITRTRSLVVRLNQAVMGKWDNYRTRRIPLAFSPSQTVVQRAQNRLLAMWDLQRMEFPQSYQLDVVPPPIMFNAALRPTISRGYVARGASAGNPTVDYDIAECLYLTCQMGLGAEGMASAELGKSQVRDLDKDGYPEFVDAWGNPIEMLRWPSGMASDVMPLKGAGTSAPYRDPVNDPDPLDFARMAVPADPVNNWMYGYRVVPVIYSFGPDGERGIFRTETTQQAQTLYSTAAGSAGFSVPAYLNPWFKPNSTVDTKYPAPWELGQCGGRLVKSGTMNYDLSADNISSHQPGMK